MILLLTDAMERSALAAARALHRGGHEIHVISGRPRSLAGASRGVREWIVEADPLRTPTEWAAGVIDRGQRLEAEGILPMTDHAMAALLPHQDAPGVPRLLAPPRAAWALASDKDALLPLAAASGFGVPATLRIPSPGAVPDTSALSGFTPGFVKPHRSVVDVEGEVRKLGVVPVATPEACAAALDALPEQAFPVLLQRRVEGAGAGIFVLRWDGRIVACFGHRRIREIPPTGGVSVYRESVAVDPGMLRRTDALLDRLGWQGVAMVECKVDAATGEYVIMEINGRFWGSLQLALDAGVDFPNLLVDCVRGVVPAEPPGYSTGIRTRWEWGEMDFLWQASKAGRTSGDGRLRAGLRALRGVLGVSRRDHLEVLRLRDPLPFAVESARRLGLLR